MNNPNPNYIPPGCKKKYGLYIVYKRYNETPWDSFISMIVAAEDENQARRILPEFCHYGECREEIKIIPNDKHIINRWDDWVDDVNDLIVKQISDDSYYIKPTIVSSEYICG